MRTGRTRYRLLETVRQYAPEKLGSRVRRKGVRARHRDHYVTVASVLNFPERLDYLEHRDRIDGETDNLRSAFRWSLEPAI